MELSSVVSLKIGDVPHLVPDHPGHVVYDEVDAEPVDAMITNERNETPGVQMIGIVGDAGIFGRGDELGRESEFAYRLLITHRIGEGRSVLALFSIFHPGRRQVQTRKTFGQHQWMIIEVRRVTGDPARKLGPLLE